MDNFFSKAYADTLYVGLAGGTMAGNIDMSGFNLINADTISAIVIDKNGFPVATELFVSSGYQPLDADLTAIAALAGTSGFLKKTAANTWSLDTATYATSTHVHGNITNAGAIGSTSGLTVETTTSGVLTTNAVTGTGSHVKATSPTLVTPTLGDATCTTLTIGTALLS